MEKKLTAMHIIWFTNWYAVFGAVAQLGEHHVRNVGVAGSIPVSSTIFT